MFYAEQKVLPWNYQPVAILKENVKRTDSYNTKTSEPEPTTHAQQLAEDEKHGSVHVAQKIVLKPLTTHTVIGTKHLPTCLRWNRNARLLTSSWSAPQTAWWTSYRHKPFTCTYATSHASGTISKMNGHHQKHRKFKVIYAICCGTRRDSQSENPEEHDKVYSIPRENATSGRWIADDVAIENNISTKKR